MEIKEVIFFAIGFSIFIVIIAFFKMKKKQRIGYLVNLFYDGFNLKVGILNLDYEKTFTIAIENTGNKDIIVTDIYIEIKDAGRFKKYVLPNTVFDNTNELLIPAGDKGAAMMDLKSFKKIFKAEAIFKSVVVIKNGDTVKSNNLLISGKKKEITLN